MDVVLSDKLAALAKEELREDKETRDQALGHMKEFLNKHVDIDNCRQDSLFLLRFLRTKKMSAPLAQQLLERYLTVRTLYPSWFGNLDPVDSHLEKIIDSGYIFPLLEKDSLGRTVIFTCMAKFDPNVFTSVDMIRAHALLIESLLDDHENQIRGYTHINDESGLTMGHITMWSVNDIRNVVRFVQNSVPARLKTTHFLNVPSFAAKIFELFTSLLSEKLRKRVFIHKSLDELKEQVDVKILPKEYGGEVPMADMIAAYKKKLLGMRDSLVALDKMKIEITKNNCLAVEIEDAMLTGVAGSFRKLQVD